MEEQIRKYNDEVHNIPGTFEAEPINEMFEFADFLVMRISETRNALASMIYDITIKALR